MARRVVGRRLAARRWLLGGRFRDIEKAELIQSYVSDRASTACLLIWGWNGASDRDDRAIGELDT